MKSILLFCVYVWLSLGAISSAFAKPAPTGTLYLENSIAGGLRLYWLFLANDGTFVKDPKFGVDPVNYGAEKQSNSANVGTYKKIGNKITVTYLSGKTEQWSIEYLNGKLNTIDGLFASVQSPLPSNFKLDGTFKSNLTYGDVASSQTYTFSQDGTVAIQGLGAVRSAPGSYVASSVKKGTYNITGNTLTITFDNQQHMVAVIGLLPGNKPSIIINGSFFK